jgi:hypothetical protein
MAIHPQIMAGQFKSHGIQELIIKEKYETNLCN